MTVYVEYVFIDNFFIDLMLFNTAFKITGREVSRLRLIVCSALGAVFALIYPLITDKAVIIIAAKILFGLFLAFCAAKFYCCKEYFAFVAIFFGLTFLVGGAVIGIFTLFNIDYSSEISVALMILPVYVLINAVNSVLRYVFRKKDAACFTVKAEIICDDKAIEITGFFDTGNALYDGLSPVILVDNRLIKQIISPEIVKRAKYITVETAVGKRKKICFKPKALVIYSGGKKNIFNNVSVCAAGRALNGYDAILHPALMELSDEIKIAM